MDTRRKSDFDVVYVSGNRGVHANNINRDKLGSGGKLEGVGIIRTASHKHTYTPNTTRCFSQKEDSMSLQI